MKDVLKETGKLIKVNICFDQVKLMRNNHKLVLCFCFLKAVCIGNRFAVVAVEIRPPPARTKIGVLACYEIFYIGIPVVRTEGRLLGRAVYGHY